MNHDLIISLLLYNVNLSYCKKDVMINEQKVLIRMTVKYSNDSTDTQL